MMKSIFLTAVIVLLSCIGGVAQETSSAPKTKKLSGFQWLKQFEGTWLVVSKSSGANAGETNSHSVGITAKAIGTQWIVSEQRGKMAGMDFSAVQTLGYDAKKKQFIGSWVDSTSTYTWQLTGSLDDSGEKLTMDSEGADWKNPIKTRRYRDMYKFKSESEIATESQLLNDAGQWETFMTSTMTRKKESMTTDANKTSVTPFLMFTGKAEEAIEYYKTVFPDLKIVSTNKYKEGEAGKEGTIQLARITIAGQSVMCTDSPPVHDFDFTPSFSFFVECEDMDQLKERFEKLSADGKVMMPLGDYGFSEQFGWASDKFGVSWQLNLNMK
jgi:predicted 3-demethylubiquinone-9 3-methyltransferase (glyoxalase superfamily)